MSRFLIVDDDAEIRDFITTDLEMSGFSVDSAADGQAGLNMALKSDYELIILDVMMPKMDGFEVCQNIRKVNKKVPILLLTAKGAIEDKVSGFNSGADDYLVKPFDIQELLVRIRALLRRNIPLNVQSSSAETLALGEIKLFPEALETSIKGHMIKLTPTEFEILYCLMQYANKAVSLTTLLNEVWGYDEDEDVRMVRVHVGGLRQKIETNPKHPEFLHTVTGVGYKLTPFGEL